MNDLEIQIPSLQGRREDLDAEQHDVVLLEYGSNPFLFHFLVSLAPLTLSLAGTCSHFLTVFKKYKK